MSDAQQPQVPARKIGIPLWIGIFMMPQFFAWLTLRQGHTTAQRLVAFSWPFCLTALVVGLHVAEHGFEGSAATGSMADAQQMQRQEAPLPLESEIPLRVVVNEDHRDGIKDQKARRLVIQGPLDEPALSKALTDYYRLMRAELKGSPNETRHIWLHAYPTEARAKGGGGEWHGMASARAFEGAPLPEQPELMFKLPRPGAAAPTELEEQIYDEMLQALAAVDSAGDYEKKVVEMHGKLEQADFQKINRLNEQDETNVRRALAKKYKLTPKQVDELHIKVFTYRNPR